MLSDIRYALVFLSSCWTAERSITAKRKTPRRGFQDSTGDARLLEEDAARPIDEVLKRYNVPAATRRAAQPAAAQAAAKRAAAPRRTGSFVFSYCYSNFWLLFGKLERLVLGCINAKFCK